MSQQREGSGVFQIRLAVCIYIYMLLFLVGLQKQLAFCFQHSVFVGSTKARERKPQGVKDAGSILVFSCLALGVNDCRVLDYV